MFNKARLSWQPPQKANPVCKASKPMFVWLSTRLEGDSNKAQGTPEAGTNTWLGSEVSVPFVTSPGACFQSIWVFASNIRKGWSSCPRTPVFLPLSLSVLLCNHHIVSMLSHWWLGQHGSEGLINRSIEAVQKFTRGNETWKKKKKISDAHKASLPAMNRFLCEFHSSSRKQMRFLSTVCFFFHVLHKNTDLCREATSSFLGNFILDTETLGAWASALSPFFLVVLSPSCQVTL